MSKVDKLCCSPADRPIAPSGPASRNCNMRVLSLVAVFICLLSISTSGQPRTALPSPLPEFFGVYAVHKEQFIPLERHAQSDTLQSSIGGADLLRDLSGLIFPDGDLKFLIHHNQAAYLTGAGVQVKKIARVFSQLTLNFAGNKVESQEILTTNMWHVLDKGHTLRVAPVAKNPQMMVLAVPEKPLPAGIWAVVLGDTIYDFAIVERKIANLSDMCVNRVTHITGVTYRPCSAPESKNVTAWFETDVHEAEIKRALRRVGKDGKVVLYRDRLSPRGNFIAFVLYIDTNSDGKVDFEDNGDIYAMNIDGSNVRNLTNHPSNEIMFSWSPDERQIVFSSDRSGKGDLYILDLPSDKVTRITTDSGWGSHPTWSPDGRYIVFYTSDGSGSYVSIVHPDGSGLKRLTDDVGNGWGLVWTPTGKISFPYRGYRYVVNSDGSGFSQEK